MHVFRGEDWRQGIQIAHSQVLRMAMLHFLTPACCLPLLYLARHLVTVPSTLHLLCSASPRNSQCL